MGVFESIKGWKLSWNTNSELVKPLTFEVLEPRILLSGDSMLNSTLPDHDQDLSLDGMQDGIQYAELLDANEQVEERISLELAPPDTTNNDVCQPIFNLTVDDENISDESVDADLNVDNIGLSQLNNDIAVLSNDPDEYIVSKVDTSEDGKMPIYVAGLKV